MSSATVSGVMAAQNQVQAEGMQLAMATMKHDLAMAMIRAIQESGKGLA